jgi:hypothetical protein
MFGSARRSRRFSESRLQEFLEFVSSDVLLLKIKLEKVGVERNRSGLVLGVMVGVEVWVLQALFNGHSLPRAERQSPLEEIDGRRARLGVQALEALASPDRQITQIIPRSSRGHVVELLHRRCAQDVQNQLELIVAGDMEL